MIKKSRQRRHNREDVTEKTRQRRQDDREDITEKTQGREDKTEKTQGRDRLVSVGIHWDSSVHLSRMGFGARQFCQKKCL